METPEPRDALGATSIDSDIAADAVSNASLPDTAPDAPPNTGAARGIADPRARSVPSGDLRPTSSEAEGTTENDDAEDAAKPDETPTPTPTQPFSDPVADATMAKILASATATRLRRESEFVGGPNAQPRPVMDRSVSTPTRPTRRATRAPDATSPKGRRHLEKEIRRLSRARSAPDARPDRGHAAHADDDPFATDGERSSLDGSLESPGGTTPTRDRVGAGNASIGARRSLRGGFTGGLTSSPSLASVAEDDDDGATWTDEDDEDEDESRSETDSITPLPVKQRSTHGTQGGFGARRALRSVSTFLFGGNTAASGRAHGESFSADTSGRTSRSFNTPHQSKRASVISSSAEPPRPARAADDPPAPHVVLLRRRRCLRKRTAFDLRRFSLRCQRRTRVPRGTRAAPPQRVGPLSTTMRRVG